MRHCCTSPTRPARRDCTTHRGGRPDQRSDAAVHRKSSEPLNTPSKSLHRQAKTVIPSGVMRRSLTRLDLLTWAVTATCARLCSETDIDDEVFDFWRVIFMIIFYLRESCYKITMKSSNHVQTACGRLSHGGAVRPRNVWCTPRGTPPCSSA